MASHEVTLRPMRDDEFEPWLTDHSVSYVLETQQRLDVGREEAEKLVRRDMASALPDGLATEGAHICVALDEAGEQVGTVWWARHPRRADAAFIYDIEIDEERRGHGFGRATMQAAQRAAREAGYVAMGLTVTGDNAPARTLYESLGYTAQSISMLRPLTDAPGE